MIKKIIELFDCTSKEAELYFFAYTNGLTHLLKNDVKSTLEQIDLKVEDNRLLYDSIVKELESRGITNRRLAMFQGYNTIVYSRNLGQTLNLYCRKYGLEAILDILEEYYKNGLKKAVNTMTLGNFFKDVNGGGINYYIEQNELLL